MNNQWIPKINTINEDKKNDCVDFLKELLAITLVRESDLIPLHLYLSPNFVKPQQTPEEPLFEVLKRMRDRDGNNWFLGHHLSLGMWIRNNMRSAGHGETELGVDNLDDCYIEMVEEALDD